ncbi:MAG: ATP-binding protein [Marinilabiliales bacterium]|nr:ATP-binding protein [Marinilabiliales bacterium]
MEATKSGVKQNLKEEKQSLRSILNEEYGWFSKDTSVVTVKEQKPRFRINWEEGITPPDTIKQDTIRKDQKNSGIKNLFNKIKKAEKLNVYSRKTVIKALLLIAVVLLGIGSQRYTRALVMRLKAEERSKVELWAMATASLITSSGEQGENYDLIATIIENNTSVPLILTDGNGEIISSANFSSGQAVNREFLQKELRKISEKTEPIKIDLGEGHFNYIYYKDSTVLRKVKFYPFVQLLVIFLLAAVSYTAFSSSRKSEENQLWAAMSKETAHQLGTPVSSLSAWSDMLREKIPGEPLTEEMEKDIKRLEKVVQRFSGIGSMPVPEVCDLVGLVTRTVNYLKNRTSSKVSYTINNTTPDLLIPVSVNQELIEWVVENICKNAVDAMEGQGALIITFSYSAKQVIVDFKDTGKGFREVRTNRYSCLDAPQKDMAGVLDYHSPGEL